MRICYVLPHGWRFASWSLSDVLERYHFSKHIASAMAHLGHEVTLVLLHESVRTHRVVQTEPFRIEIFPVTFTIPLFRFGGDFSLPLIRKVRRLDVEVLHVHGCFYESLPWLVGEANVPTVLQWHGGRLTPLHRAAFLPAYRKSRRIIIPFMAVRDLFPRMGPRTEKFEVIPLPLRPEVRTATPKSQYGRGVPRLLCVGRIPRPGRNLWDRRLDILLQILGRMRATRFFLDVVGDGPGRSLCEKIAREEGIADVVNFHGYLGLDQILALYRNSDLNVVPFSLPDLTGTWVAQIQESLGVGTPVVAFSPNNTYSEHDIGWRISADPVEGTAQLKNILSRPDVIESKGRDGPSLVRSQCDEQTISRQLESLYRATEMERS
jgi:glycosyltransferase involved in cell wall biosynthesis